jgi:CRISPR-associated protein Csb1
MTAERWNSMEKIFNELKNAPRLLLEATLKPVQGNRFQPTGFPDLGAARYALPDGTEMMIVESAQSVANRMELACCGNDKLTLLKDLAGLPYIVGKYDNEILTTSYLEAHRLSSPYLLNSEWAKKLSQEMQLRDDYQINDKKVVKVLFKYDPCCLLHGVWLGTKDYKIEFSGGRIRLTRILSGFIEAKNVVIAESGGTKFDKNAARLTETGNAETGYGTLPFHRTEFTAEVINAYFNIDLALLRGYGLGDNATKLLITLGLFKIQRFLSTGLRLRTACDLEVDGDLSVTRPKDISIPSETDLLLECKSLIEKCKAEGLFAVPHITEVLWAKKKASATIVLPIGTTEPTIPDDLKKIIIWKKGSKSEGPKLEFKEGLDNAIIDKAKALFADNESVQKIIDDAIENLNKASEEENQKDIETEE